MTFTISPSRTVSTHATSELMERFFPGTYELVAPGAARDAGAVWPWDDRTTSPNEDDERPVRIAFCLEEERGALRLFLRALRRLPLDRDWEAAIWLPDAGEVRIARRLRERIRVVTIAPGYIRTPMTAHNPYKMPFLMDADVFARKAVRKIGAGTRFAVIPWQMGVVASLLHVMPRWLYDALFRRAPRKPRQSRRA